MIQHSNRIDEYFAIIEKAGRENEIPLTLVAKLKDRMLMYKGEEQIYGTQAKSRFIKGTETGEHKWQFYIRPIRSLENVIELRRRSVLMQRLRSRPGR